MPASPGPRGSANEIPRKPLPSSKSANHHPSKKGPLIYTVVSQQDASPTRKPQARTRRVWTQFAPGTFWASEIVSVGLALAMLAAIVTLLAARRDKPLPDWPSLLQINSLVAIFTSIFKVALLFPVTEGISELNRGPYGAFKLLVKNSSNLLASIGAAIIVLALAVDPFTQQVLNFYSCPIKVDRLTANVARTNNYTIGEPAADSAGASIDAKMTGALYQGMLNPPANSSAALSAYCASGNCTFPHSNNVAYSSLAMCSSVEEISSSVSGNATYEPSGEEDIWHYILPSGLNISAPYAMATGGIQYEGLIQANQPLFSFEALMVTTNCSISPNFQHTNECPITPLAVRITLSPCVLVYGNVSVSNSIFQEHVESIGMLPNTGWGYGLAGNYSSFPGTDCSASTIPQGSKSLPATLSQVVSDSNQVTVRCVDIVCTQNTTDIVWYDPACVFSLSWGASGGLGSALGDMFGWMDTPSNLWLDYGIWRGASGDVWLKVLWANGMANVTSISNTMEGLTSTINAVFRQEGDTSNSVPARGATFSNQTCVGIMWAWIAYPCTLVLWTLVFLVITMVQSHNSTRKGGAEEGRRPWKSSTLPLLWCGLQDSTRDRYHRLDKLEQMMEFGNETWVNLRTEENIKRRSDGQSAVQRGRWVLKEAPE